MYLTWFNYLSPKDKAVPAEFTEKDRRGFTASLQANLVHGDRLNLVTCSYHDHDGRFVVIGREIEND